MKNNIIPRILFFFVLAYMLGTIATFGMVIVGGVGDALSIVIVCNVILACFLTPLYDKVFEMNLVNNDKFNLVVPYNSRAFKLIKESFSNIEDLEKLKEMSFSEDLQISSIKSHIEKDLIPLLRDDISDFYKKINQKVDEEFIDWLITYENCSSVISRSSNFEDFLKKILNINTN